MHGLSIPILLVTILENNNGSVLAALPSPYWSTT